MEFVIVFIKVFINTKIKAQIALRSSTLLKILNERKTFKTKWYEKFHQHVVICDHFAYTYRMSLSITRTDTGFAYIGFSYIGIVFLLHPILSQPGPGFRFAFLKFIRIR